MENGVFYATNVEVNARGWLFASGTGGNTHPILFSAAVRHGVGIVGIEIPQVIPATAGPLRHSVCFAPGAVRQADPFFDAREGRFGFRAGSGLEVAKFRR